VKKWFRLNALVPFFFETEWTLTLAIDFDRGCRALALAINQAEPWIAPCAFFVFWTVFTVIISTFFTFVFRVFILSDHRAFGLTDPIYKFEPTLAKIARLCRAL
jgi:hypothetical protein